MKESIDRIEIEETKKDIEEMTEVMPCKVALLGLYFRNQSVGNGCTINGGIEIALDEYGVEDRSERFMKYVNLYMGALILAGATPLKTIDKEWMAYERETDS